MKSIASFHSKNFEISDQCYDIAGLHSDKYYLTWRNFYGYSGILISKILEGNPRKITQKGKHGIIQKAQNK